MNEQLQRLIALAQTDDTLSMLANRLKELQAQEKVLQDRIAQEEAAWRARQEAHRKLRAEALAKMNEVDATDEKIRTYQRKLERDILPYKEMEFLREQVTLLKSRMDTLAEEALMLSEEAERDAEKLKEDEAAHKERRRQLEEEMRQLLDHRAELQREQERLQAEREERAAQVPPHLLQHYERLRRTARRPVVPVEGGACGGCHLRLSETTLTKVQGEREVVTCENCSRFLYWRSP